MKLNLNGVSARLYRWFYVTNTMPQSLCPYFWKLVIAYIFIVPIAVLSVPIFLFRQQDSIEKPGQRFFIGALLWVVLSLAIMMIVGPLSTLFTGLLHDGSFLAMIQSMGFLTLFVVVLFCLIGGIIYLASKIKEENRRRRSEWIWDEYGDYIKNPDYSPYAAKPNIIIEFIKATYHKYCPKIDWK